MYLFGVKTAALLPADALAFSQGAVTAEDADENKYLKNFYTFSIVLLHFNARYFSSQFPKNNPTRFGDKKIYKIRFIKASHFRGIGAFQLQIMLQIQLPF